MTGMHGLFWNFLYDWNSLYVLNIWNDWIPSTSGSLGIFEISRIIGIPG